MLKNIYDFLLFDIIPPLAILMVAIGGFFLIIAYATPTQGGPDMINRAKRIFKAVVFGILISYGAWVIINFFFQAIGVAEWTGIREGWWKIECPTTTSTSGCPPSIPAPYNNYFNPSSNLRVGWELIKIQGNNAYVCTCGNNQQWQCKTESVSTWPIEDDNDLVKYGCPNIDIPYSNIYTDLPKPENISELQEWSSNPGSHREWFTPIGTQLESRTENGITYQCECKEKIYIIKQARKRKRSVEWKCTP